MTHIIDLIEPSLARVKLSLFGSVTMDDLLYELRKTLPLMLTQTESEAFEFYQQLPVHQFYAAPSNQMLAFQNEDTGDGEIYVLVHVPTSRFRLCVTEHLGYCPTYLLLLLVAVGEHNSIGIKMYGLAVGSTDKPFDFGNPLYKVVCLDGVTAPPQKNQVKRLIKELGFWRFVTAQAMQQHGILQCDSCEDAAAPIVLGQLNEPRGLLH